MNAAQVIVSIWIGLVLVTLITGGIVLAWAIRTRQFSNQDRARYLPLGEPLPEQDKDQHDDSGRGKGKGNA